MKIDFYCQCGQKLTADVQYAGRETKCPKCGTPLTVPTPSNSTSSTDVTASDFWDDTTDESASQNDDLPSDESPQRSTPLATNGAGPATPRVVNPLLVRLRDRRERCMWLIDVECKRLVQSNNILTAIDLFDESADDLRHIHSLLFAIATRIMSHENLLNELGWNSNVSRKQLLSSLFVFLDCACRDIHENWFRRDWNSSSDDTDIRDSTLGRTLMLAESLGMLREHPLLSNRLLTELELFLYFLEMTIEPSWMPFAASADNWKDDGTPRTDSVGLSDEIRLSVWDRDRGVCAECAASENVAFEFVIPPERGGASTVRNVRLLCRKCAGKAGDTLSSPDQNAGE